MTTPTRYIPKAGDIVWLDFDPAEGHEQKGHRPALIISRKLFSEKTGFAIACPITNTISSYPTHFALDSRTATTGNILCEQAKSLDYKARRLRFIEEIPEDLLSSVIACVTSFIE